MMLSDIKGKSSSKIVIHDRLYLLCKDDEDYHGAFEVLGYHKDKEFLEAKALKLCWDNYRKAKEKFNGIGGNVILSPVETEYRRFFVKEVFSLE
jgi:hypothetical protein